MRLIWVTPYIQTHSRYKEMHVNIELAIAILSSISSLIIAITSIVINNRVLGFKVDELTKKVEEHNKLVERVAIIERDVKTAFNRIDENRDEVKLLRK